MERTKSKRDKISVPVPFGTDGRIERSFEADAFQESSRTVLEVEAGRAVTNNQILKDLFEACVMHDVRYLAVALRLQYRDSKDFERASGFFDTLYASRRLTLPLEGILIVGH